MLYAKPPAETWKEKPLVRLKVVSRLLEIVSQETDVAVVRFDTDFSSVIEFDGKKITSSSDITKTVLITPIGKKVGVKVLRDGAGDIRFVLRAIAFATRGLSLFRGAVAGFARGASLKGRADDPADQRQDGKHAAAHEPWISSGELAKLIHRRCATRENRLIVLKSS